MIRFHDDDDDDDDDDDNPDSASGSGSKYGSGFGFRIPDSDPNLDQDSQSRSRSGIQNPESRSIAGSRSSYAFRIFIIVSSSQILSILIVVLSELVFLFRPVLCVTRGEGGGGVWGGVMHTWV